jgi:hypothetical protein
LIAAGHASFVFLNLHFQKLHTFLQSSVLLNQKVVMATSAFPSRILNKVGISDIKSIFFSKRHCIAAFLWSYVWILNDDLMLTELTRLIFIDAFIGSTTTFLSGIIFEGLQFSEYAFIFVLDMFDFILEFFELFL